MRTQRLTLFPFIALAVATACVRSLQNVAPSLCPGICSEGSTYSPTLRLFVTTTLSADALVVHLDSGIVRVPGAATSSDSPPLMEHLYLRAFVAVDLDSSAALAVREHAWRAIAWSDSIPLAGQMRYGEVGTIPTETLRLTLTATRPLSQEWLGFAVTGDAVNSRTATPAQRLIRSGVRVYACDQSQLNGSQNVSRTVRLQSEYSGAC